MAELKNLRPFLQYWDQVANSYDEQVDVYSKLTGAIIHDWVYDYTKDGDLSVANGDLDWITDPSATDEQKLAAFDQWLGFNTTEDAIVPTIEYYLNEHHDEIEQEIQNQELTLENVTDDSAERYMDVLEMINDEPVPDKDRILGYAGSYAYKRDGKWQIQGSHNAFDEPDEKNMGYKFAGNLKDLPDDAPVYAFTNKATAPDGFVGFITTKQELLEQTEDVLQLNGYPTTDHNLYKIAEEILDKSNWEHTGEKAAGIAVNISRYPEDFKLDGPVENKQLEDYIKQFASVADRYGLTLNNMGNIAVDYDTQEVWFDVGLAVPSVESNESHFTYTVFNNVLEAAKAGKLEQLAMKQLAKDAEEMTPDSVQTFGPHEEDLEERIANKYQEISAEIQQDLADYKNLEKQTGPKVISYDMETTGLHPDQDDILKLSIVDGDGNELFNKLFKPTKKDEWPEAEKVNKITPEIAMDHAEFKDWQEQVQRIFDQADVIVGYNQRHFDDRFLAANGIKIDPAKENHDLMLEYAQAVGEPVTLKNGKTQLRWFKLEQAAAFYGHDWGAGKAHDSLADARATAFVYQQMHPKQPVQPKEMVKEYLNYLHQYKPQYENAPMGISTSLSMFKEMSDYLVSQQRTPRYTPRQLQSMVRQGLTELEQTKETVYHDERVEAVKDKILTDDPTDTGGKSYADETTEDFMQTVFGQRLDVDFKELNDALKETGIEPFADPYAQQKLDRAAQVLKTDYAQDQSIKQALDYLHDKKQPLTKRLEMATSIMTGRQAQQPAKTMTKTHKSTRSR